MNIFQEILGVVTNSHYRTPTHTITYDFDITDEQKATAIEQNAAGYGPRNWEQGEIFVMLGLRDSNPHIAPERREPAASPNVRQPMPAGKRPAWHSMFVAE